MASKYGKAAKKEVEKEMHRFKRGKAHSGTKHKKVTSRKQAVAIGLSKARKKGAKVPQKKAKSVKSAKSAKSTKSVKSAKSKSWIARIKKAFQSGFAKHSWA